MSRTTTSELSEPVDEERDQIQGPNEAPVTLLEYGDYECHYCGQAYPIIKEVQERLGDQLRFVFRNFPVRSMHPHAEHAAEAAEGAAVQGKFWEMHDQLYEHQNALEDDDLRDYADALDLDSEQFARELHEHVHEERVEEDIISGARSGVNGTPTFFINGERFDGNWTDVDVFVSAIEERIQSLEQ